MTQVSINPNGMCWKQDDGIYLGRITKAQKAHTCQACKRKIEPGNLEIVCWSTDGARMGSHGSPERTCLCVLHSLEVDVL